MGDLSRAARILLSLWAYVGWLLLVRTRLVRPIDHPAVRLRRLLEELGTTFVKLGQMASLRHDLLPEAYAKSLDRLQDHVAPFATDIARREIERALGKPIDALFSTFEDEPFAAASIAQVHRAELHDGRKVIVKVRRPGLEDQIARDVRLLSFALRLASAFFPMLRRHRVRDLLDEFHGKLRKELDFRLEARNMRRFAEGFRESETVYVPEVIEGLFDESVIVQARSGGDRVDALSPAEDGPALARAFVAAYMHQFFVIGAFHGDPHPGNLFIMDDQRICFHDFGLVGVIDKATRRGLGAYMQALRYQDADWLIDACVDLGIVARSAIGTRLRGEIEDLIEEFASRQLRQWSLAEPFVRLLRFGGARGEIQAPHNLLVLIRTLYLVESTVRMLDPDYSLLDGLAVALAGVSARGRSDDDDAQTARLKFEADAVTTDLRATIGSWMHKARVQGIEPTIRHRGLESFEHSLERAGNRVALALVTLGLYVASSLLMQYSLGPRIWGMPLLGVAGYLLAIWFTGRLVHGIARARGL